MAGSSDGKSVVGAPVAGVALRIVGPDGRLLPEGQVGHLHVSGTTLLREYHGNPDANASSFTDDGWFDTGDLGFLWNGRLALTGELPRAVAGHEFAVSFQPIVDLASGQVVGAEALTRWHHPTGGTVDPARFLEAVERSGLLPAFAEAVLDQALIALVSWREAGFDVPVAVNVSPRSLLDARFPGSVLARLRAHDLPPDRLMLELYRDIYSGRLDNLQMFLLKEFFEILEKAIDRCREAGVVAYEIVLKNS